mgnify:CR=1 FL=1
MTQPPEQSDLTADSRNKLIAGADLHLVHWLVIALSIILTLSAWYFSKEQLNQKIEAKFNREADQVVGLLKDRMQLYENALWGGVAFIDASISDISYPQWKNYADSLNIDQTYPGINGIGVIYNIQTAEMSGYLAEERLLRPDYKLHPKHNEAEYWPITYIEPSSTNTKAIGLDMAFETNRYTGIKNARDSGTAQLTGPITLVQDSKKTPGFLFYTPFYKKGLQLQTIKERQNAILGVTYAPFIMYKLMQGALSIENRQVGIKITDAGELLYEDEQSDSPDFDPTPLYKKQLSLSIYGRNWLFDIQSDLQFREASANNQPRWILLGGIIIDSLLLSLFLFLSKANRKALTYADKMTIELEAETKRLEKSNRDLEQFSHIASHDLKSPLNAIKQLVSWIEEDCADVLPEESKEHLGLLRKRSERMMKLLHDLLEYSRINRHDYDSEVINLSAMTKDIFELLNVPSNFSYSAPDIEMNVPKIPFEIVLRNLVSNAVKHHDKEQGSINITYQLTNNMHRFVVQDNGPGIPKNMHTKVMEMFQTLKPRDRVEGSGMGLAIVKRIIEHHQGTITIDSTMGEGTSFIVSWPA